MGQGILLVMYGVFVIILSQTSAKLIAMKYSSTTLESLLKIVLFLFGLVFVSLGSLISLQLLNVYQPDPQTTQPIYKSIFFLVIGTSSFVMCPFITNKILKKYPDHPAVLLIGKQGFYIFYIGIGIIALTSGLFGLFKLI